MAQSALDAAREALTTRLYPLMVAPLPALDAALLPPVTPVPADAQERALAAAMVAATSDDTVLRAHGTDWLSLLLNPHDAAGPRELMAQGESRGGRWPSLQADMRTERPPWVAELVAQKLKSMSLPARAPSVASPPPRGQLRWQPPINGLPDAAEARALVPGTPPDALVWAGPAVRDGVTSYQTTGGRTRVRVPLVAAPVELHAWAQRFGHAMQLRLRDPASAYAPLIAEATTSIPAAVLHPEGLVPAQITGFAAGGRNSCDGGHWLELTLDAQGPPPGIPVWAVFIFSRPDLAQGVSVRRLPVIAADQHGYREAQRSELEVRWPGDWLPTLTVSARRFDYGVERYEQQPDGQGKLVGTDVLGSVWGTQVWTAAPKALVASVGPRLLLSAGGSPECAPP